DGGGAHLAKPVQPRTGRGRRRRSELLVRARRNERPSDERPRRSADDEGDEGRRGLHGPAGSGGHGAREQEQIVVRPGCSTGRSSPSTSKPSRIRTSVGASTP